MTARDNPPTFSWASRWGQLARTVGLSGREPVLVALSGGADSVFLLNAVARAAPRPKILAVYVEHGLRGEESRGDAAFCARICARLSVPFACRELGLEPGPNQEARAREGRYRALFDEARHNGYTTILTGHHEDDALETLLIRWMRGSGLPGLAGLKAHNVLSSGRPDSAITVVRPLLAMRREEVRRVLRDQGIAWREDSSNDSPVHTRNRVRNDLLPSIEQTCGKEGIAGLRAFASAVESLEDELAGRTAHLSWTAPRHAAASRSHSSAHLGGVLERSAVDGLAAPLQRRALWRLIREGTGHTPSRALLGLIESDLIERRNTRRALPGGWTLQLRKDQLSLIPPGNLILTGGNLILTGGNLILTGGDLVPPGGELRDVDSQQESLEGDRTGPRSASDSEQTTARSGSATGSPISPPAPGRDGAVDSLSGAPRHQAQPVSPPSDGLRLGLPGFVPLPDGRSVHAEIIEVDDPGCLPRGAALVELDATDLPGELVVRWVRPGDRFHGLGAPGSRPVRRFLADAGIPREDRGRVPLVFAGSELIWVAGVRPCERRRVRPGSSRRLRLWLEGAAEVELPSTGS
ncbi:MAG: tRNA lysidine(34) synthetase TilS [bacterium]|nr:tRNA lysidine(34) synthetase TilS [bacterium]